MKDTDYKEVEKQYNKSMFRKLYDGDYGLAKTFWSGFFIFNIGGVIFVTPSLIQDTNPTFVFAFIIIWIINMIFWPFLTIRASKKYTGSKVWSFLAIVFILLALLRIALLFFHLWASLNSSSSGEIKHFGKGVEFVQSLEIEIDGEKSYYKGQIKDGKMHGIGAQVWVDGSSYVGNQKDNKSHGKGISIYANGDRYEGEWKDDKQHGKGMYIYANGDLYEGEWKDGKKHGKGIFIYTDGYRLEGVFKENSLHNGVAASTHDISSPFYGMETVFTIRGGEIVESDLLRVYTEQGENYDATLYR